MVAVKLNGLVYTLLLWTEICKLLSSAAAGTDAVLFDLAGWSNRPEHTYTPKTRLPTTDPSKLNSESQACCGEKAGSELELLHWIICYSEFFAIFLFPLLVWIIKRSQCLNIPPPPTNLGLSFAFLRYEECSFWTSWGMWAAKRGLFCVCRHHILIFYTQSLNVEAAVIIGRLVQESESDNLCPRAAAKVAGPGCSFQSSQVPVGKSDALVW